MVPAAYPAAYLGQGKPCMPPSEVAQDVTGVDVCIQAGEALNVFKGHFKMVADRPDYAVHFKQSFLGGRTEQPG